MDTIIGIDLGTTNSELAIIRDGQPFVLPDANGDPIVPSVVGLSDEGKLLVGRAARNQWVLAPERTIKSIKRQMGQDTRVKLGDQSYTPQEVSAMILRTLRERAAQALGQPVTKAVITVPAFFNDAQRQATREAGQLAGLEVMRILNEPTAAALTYDPHNTADRKVLVYDLGGGTFDVSIVRSEAGVVEVLASHGDTRLGGDDFDDLIMNRLCEQFQAEHDIDLRTNLVSKSRVLRAAENAKKALSDHPFARIEEEFIAEKAGVPLHLNTELGRQDFEDMIRPLLDRTLDCVQRSLDDAKITARQIDRIVLVGGSTRTPLIGQLLEQKLGQPAHREINPDLCVAMGAAVQGAIIAGSDVGAVLVDITPHSLGIKCLGGEIGPMGRPSEYHFAPIVQRNTPLPASRSEVFRTVADRQPAVDIIVYQGESHDVRDNALAGKFKIEGLAPVPAGNQLVVQFDLNLDGTLRVTAREKATGLVKEITIDNALSRFAREERQAAEQRLEQLWGASDFGTGGDYEGDDDEYDDDEDDDADDQPARTAVLTNPAAEPMPTLAPGPREGQRETVQARALLEKAERLRERATPEDRGELDKLTERIRTAMTDRKWDIVARTSNELSDVLFYLEDA